MSSQTQASHSIAFNKFLHFSDLWPFDLMLISGQGLMMDYPCGKFGDCSFIRFGFIICGQTHIHTDVTKHFTPVTIISTSNN